MSTLGCTAARAGGIAIAEPTGCPQPGIGIPNVAAIPAAWMALNSRTRPGMKKHSMNPRIEGIPLQKKQA